MQNLERQYLSGELEVELTLPGKKKIFFNNKNYFEVYLFLLEILLCKRGKRECSFAKPRKLVYKSHLLSARGLMFVAMHCKEGISR